jgi:hypothetical protein
MKGMLAVFPLLAIVLLGVTNLLSFQDDEAAAAARERAVQQDTARREQQDRQEDQARQAWIKAQQDASDFKLGARAVPSGVVKARENEIRFASLQESARELKALSVKINDQIEAGGAESVSLTLYSDLDRVEKIVKDIRKHAK